MPACRECHNKFYGIKGEREVVPQSHPDQLFLAGWD